MRMNFRKRRAVDLEGTLRVMAKEKGSELLLITNSDGIYVASIPGTNHWAVGINRSVALAGLYVDITGYEP